MRIWSIVLAGAGLAFGATTPVLASGTALPMLGKSFAGRPGMRPVVRSGTTVYRWGPRYQARWYAGWYAPGGWAAYRRPLVGHVLPRYWISPAYMIGDYGIYGLPVPADGYGWSRYYDDAVLTDRDGRVRDVRSGVNWDAQAGTPPPPPGMGYDDDVTAPDGPPPPGAPRQNGHFEAHGRPGVDYDAPPYAAAPPVISPRPAPGQPIVTTTQAPGTFANGYYYPGVTTTTVVIQPAVRTTRTYVTETVISRSVRRRVHRK